MEIRAKWQSLATAITLLSVLTAWSFQPHTSSGAKPIETVEADLDATILKQAEAWNQGDLVQFMSAYWKDERLTFSSGGETHRGWQVTLDRYRARYPDQATMGQLKFNNLETQLLGTDSAMTLGEWHLKRDKPAGGNFTLVWKKLDGNWFIIHDHSSSLEPKK